MNIWKIIIYLALRILGSFEVTYAKESCPRGLDSSQTFTEKLCELALNVGAALLGACNSTYGGIITHTPYSDEVVGQDLLSACPNRICNYYTDKTVVQDCYYRNGTVEISACHTIFALLYFLKDKCSYYYKTDMSKLTELANLTIAYTRNPCKNCRPNPYLYLCQEAGDTHRDRCPNCVSECGGT